MHQKNVQQTFFFILLLLTTLAFLGLIRDLLQPVFWAAVLAILFHPVQARWEKVVKGRTALASLLSLLTIILIVILPLVLIGVAVTGEVLTLYERIATGQIDLQEPLEMLERALPLANEQFERFNIDTERIRQGVAGAAVTASQYLASQALAFGQNAIRFTALLFLMLYVLFFFLRDGTHLVDALIRVLPLGDDRERRLFAKFAEVARATIKGTFVVGLVQGTIGGLLFWILGIRAAVFWGVIMTVLSLLPAIGSALVWLPAAIILLVTGEVVKGVVLIVGGTLIIGLVDNVLRPILVGRDTQMPDYLILLSTLGGLAVFGITGFVIGPIIASLFLAVWEMFAEDYAEEQDVEAVKEAARRPERVPDPQPDLGKKAEPAPGEEVRPAPEGLDRER